jgi:DNA polymerase III delta prime subunit
MEYVPLKTFQGPPGTGKTTSIHALAHELLGANFKEAVLELNASDDRFNIMSLGFHGFYFYFLRPIKIVGS